ncbi:MAG: hypothetical protein FJX78_00325 [Armatimonadetes bacterium]|nr:hypothetical protein [Armatimonadota bacterium]
MDDVATRPQGAGNGDRGGADGPGRLLGLLVFVIGVGLLIFVFLTAYQEFSGPAMARLGVPTATSPVPSENANAAASDLNVSLQLLMKAIFLFVLGYLSSAVAGRGIAMYHAARLPDAPE